MNIEQEAKVLTLSQERKLLQQNGLLPNYVTTGGWQLLKSKYLSGPELENPKLRYEAIAMAAAKHIEGKVPVFQGWNNWYDAFMFLIFESGCFSLATPILANMGSDKGLPVSCSGSLVKDSIYDMYEGVKNAAMLSKYGFGTSAYMDIRGRGEPISVGGHALGVVPFFDSFVDMSQKVSQGSQRRGAWAGYIDIDSKDFEELCLYIKQTPEDRNVGFCISDKFIERWKSGDADAQQRFAKAVSLAYGHGKGYLCKNDLANRLLPEYYKRAGLRFYASNLCTEIMVGIDDTMDYTCIISSIVAKHWDKIKNTKIIQLGTIFLDCVASEFIEKAKTLKGLEKAIKFTEKARALGIGVCGYHSYLQSKMISFGSLEASYINNEIFASLEKESLLASQYLAKYLGECELTKGSGVRNASLRAVAPTKSTALIMGGVSEGINPFSQNVYLQKTPAGEVFRVNPELLALLKSKKINTQEHINEIITKAGSVQDVAWLNDEEKLVFRTAFEIDQNVIMRLAANRQKYLDQCQSVNLFFDGKNPEEYISDVHQKFLLSDKLVCRYYINGRRNVGEHSTNKSVPECESCQ